jgi:DNA-binding MarR family transcriptional regulator
MARSRATHPSADPTAGLAFLLAQVGAHVATKFAEYLEPLGLKPWHAGILRLIKQADGLSQQALSEKLGMFPSRLVAILDELEQAGLVERREHPRDRRSYALYLTAVGRETLKRIGNISQKHQAATCAALDASEQVQLAEFLTRIVAEQGLTPGVHPGYRKLNGDQIK